MIIMHFVLGENKYTMKIVRKLVERDDGTVTVVDSRYAGINRKGDVTYTNLESVRGTLTLPDKVYFHMHMDTRDRKKKP